MAGEVWVFRQGYLCIIVLHFGWTAGCSYYSRKCLNGRDSRGPVGHSDIGS